MYLELEHGEEIRNKYLALCADYRDKEWTAQDNEQFAETYDRLNKAVGEAHGRALVEDFKKELKPLMDLFCKFYDKFDQKKFKRILLCSSTP